MFYKLIKNKCEEWMKSSDCTIRELIQYIYTKNKMRDAQIEAIKIYLFLKIACGNYLLKDVSIVWIYVLWN